MLAVTLSHARAVLVLQCLTWASIGARRSTQRMPWISSSIPTTPRAWRYESEYIISDASSCTVFLLHGVCSVQRGRVPACGHRGLQEPWFLPARQFYSHGTQGVSYCLWFKQGCAAAATVDHYCLPRHWESCGSSHWNLFELNSWRNCSCWSYSSGKSNLCHQLLTASLVFKNKAVFSF